MARSRCPNGSRKNRKTKECVRKSSGVVLARAYSAHKSLSKSASIGKIYKANSEFKHSLSNAMKLQKKATSSINQAQKTFMNKFKGNVNLANKTRRKR